MGWLSVAEWRTDGLTARLGWLRAGGGGGGGSGRLKGGGEGGLESGGLEGGEPLGDLERAPESIP